MARSSLLMVACLAGAVACGGSKGSGSTAGDAGDGGDGGNGGVVRATTCTTPNFTQGDCSWPEFCQSGKCVPAQNLNATGMDLNTTTGTAPCETSSATFQGAGNLDQDRMIEDAGIELLAPDSAVITDLNKVPITDDMDCVTYIGHNTTTFQSAANGCGGGNMDRFGRPICAATEAVMLFQGHAIDPQAHFYPTEGPALDAQFWWLVTVEAPINFLDGAFGAVQSGFIIPAWDGGWSASGGAFVMAKCLGHTDYPTDVNAYPQILHFADTGGGVEDGGAADGGGGVPGNSYCTNWVP